MEESHNFLIPRTIKIYSDQKFLDEELDIIKHPCEANYYPRKFVQNIINYNLQKRNSIAPNLNEENSSNEIFINLKYAEQKGEQLMLKMMKIVSYSSEDGVKLKVAYNSPKLSQYFNVKDPVPKRYKSDLIYKCACPQID